MAGEKRDLDYYMAHPEEMPADFHTLETGESEPKEETGSELQAAIDGEVKGVVEPKPEAKDAAKKEGDQPTDKDVEDPTKAVIKSKDGKHEIPYGVLQAEREARKAAETAMTSLQERITALEAVKETGTPKEVKEALKEEPVLSEEEIADISEISPAMAKLVKGLVAKVNDLTTELVTVKQNETRRAGAEQATAAGSVQAAIDANPVLSYWQSKDTAAFQRAVQIDNQIKADKRYASLSLDERFGKVVKAMEAIDGPVELPAEFQRKAKTEATDPKKEGEAAEKAIAAAKGKETKVASLSDIPGGVPPESDEIQQLGNLSSHELGNKFLKMTTEQQNAILARLV